MAGPNKQDSQMADADGNPLMGAAQTLVADASTAHALSATYTDTEVEAALDALGTKINALLDILEAHGLMKAS